DDLDAACNGVVTQLDRRHPAVEPGHHDVERDHIGVDVAYLVQAILSVDGGRHVEPLQLKVHGDELPNHLVVLDAQHTSQGHGRQASGSAHADTRRMATFAPPFRPWEPPTMGTIPK